MPVGLFKQPVLYTKRPGQVTALATSPWAPLVAIAGQKQVSLYHTESGDLLGILPFPEGIPQVVRFSRNGSVLLAAGGRGGQSGCVVLFDVNERQANRQDRRRARRGPRGRHQQPRTRWSPSAAPAASCGSIRPRRASCCNEIRKHTDWINAVEFSPDGKLLATADRSGGLFVWEARRPARCRTCAGHTGAINDVTWRLDSDDSGQRRRRRHGQAVGAE